jgi:hypothetical protein
MHDTALKIGGLVMRTYCPAKNARILDVGAQDMNGSLRDVAPKDADYIGLDHEAGKGVDIVVEADQPWPVEDDHFDLVLATSVLEHDPAFWETFEKMCRKARPGGHIYISAPSNGIVHRCPQDYWRFYPDSGLALKAWAARRELDVTLVESFMAEREADMWNDFCAIFRREPSPEPLNRNYVYPHVPCTNAIIWESKEVLNPRTESEDMMLIVREREEVNKLRHHIDWREHQIAGEKTAWAAEREELVRSAASASIAQAAQEQQFAVAMERAADAERDLQNHIRGIEEEIGRLRSVVSERDEQLGQLENNLAQRRAEVEEALADAANARELQRVAEDAAREYQLRIRQLGREVSEAQALVLQLTEQRTAAEDRTASIGKRLDKVERANRKITNELSRLETAVARLHGSERNLRWLREVHASLSANSWWGSWLPSGARLRLEYRRLLRAGLFDHDRYLDERPDVREAGFDPLRHYIAHGMDEAPLN